MDTKISSQFWSKREVEEAPKDVKLAALWLLTNERVTLCGYAEVSEKRFAFETGCAPEDMARAFEALPKTFDRVGKGYIARNFIRWQFGHGPALAKSHMSVPVVNALRACPVDVVEQVLEFYPELRERFEEATRKAEGRGIGSPSEAQRARARARARAGTRTGARAQGVQGEAPAARVADRPASLADAVAYFQAEGSSEEEAVKFFDHFEANGWKQGGRAAIKDWRASARSWMRRSKDFAAGSGGGKIRGSASPESPRFTVGDDGKVTPA